MMNTAPSKQPITMYPVKSSNVGAVGYDEASRRLRVAFLSGGVYDYAEVPPARWVELQGAASVGQFLHAHIKPNHAATKVGG